MTAKILIIEDEVQIARVIQLELSFEGYETDVAHSGTEGLLKFLEGNWDLVLLDVMLPEIDGFEVLKRIRKHNAVIPVLLLTAKDQIQDKVAGLDLGANDYITKPFEFEELLARIRASLRLSKQQSTQSSTLEFLDLTIDENTREVFRAQHLIELTQREYDLLLHLMKNARNVQTRDQLLSAVWGFDYYGDTNVVDVYIRYLRQKLDIYGPSLIQTVRGVGYVLKEPRDEA